MRGRAMARRLLPGGRVPILPRLTGACTLVLMLAVHAAGAPMRLAVVANKANPVTDLTSAQLRDLLLGRQATWPNGRRVILVLLQRDAQQRAALLRWCCHMTSEDYDRHMLHALFTGQVSTEPKLVSSDTAIKKFVFNVPGGLGTVDVQAVDNSVRVLRIDGHLPTDPGYPLVLR
jgi:phosphate transport system substrate-binding protein